MADEAIYLRWGPNRNRADDLARALGAELAALRWQTKDWIRTPLRYAVQFVETVLLLLWKRPRVIFTQHTQPFCSLAALIYTKMTGTTLVTDCHNGPFVDRLWRRWPMGWLNRLIFARAKLNLVHNESIRRFAVEKLKVSGEFAVLWDRIPTPSEDKPAPGRPEYALAVCSFSADEPIEALFDAARLTPDVQYRITGNANRLKPSARVLAGSNVCLTGYLPDDAYDELLAGATVVVALSAREHVLTRACHEAIGAERAFVTSDSLAAREYLTGGTIFVENAAASIARGVREAIRNRTALEEQMREVKQKRQAEWAKQVEAVRVLLNLESERTSVAANTL